MYVIIFTTHQSGSAKSWSYKTFICHPLHTTAIYTNTLLLSYIWRLLGKIMKQKAAESMHVLSIYVYNCFPNAE